MGIIAKYKFNQNIYENFIPTFNSGFTYTVTDEIDTDGYIIRTIESDDLPTLMLFGSSGISTKREQSLLAIYECNTEKVTNMSYMFCNCSSLTTLNLSNFNTQKVTSMSYMFSNCSKLMSLDLSNFNTEETLNMSYMFRGCTALASLNISSFNTKKVANMSYMFQNCSSLTTLDVSSFNTEAVTNMGEMFRGCKKLTALDLSNFNVSNVTAVNSIFYDCEKLELIDMSNFDTSKVTANTGLFTNCNNLKTLGLIYSSSDTINAVTPLLSVNTEKNIYYLDASISELTPINNINFIYYEQSVMNIDEDITLRSNGNICDELDLLTGQLTQRIAEDGSILEDEIVKQVQLSGDTLSFYNTGSIQIETNEITPTFEIQPNITNYYEVPSLKPNTQYTLFFKGVPTKVDLGGTVVENPTTKSLIISGEVDKVLWFDTSVNEVMLIEGDLTNRDVEYFTGVKSSQKIEVQLRLENAPYFGKGGRR